MTGAPESDGLQELAVLDIFSDDRYRIPLYQRAYAWTASEIHTLLVDIQDARKLNQLRDDNHQSRKYYLGSLVVDTSRSEDEEVHEVVDGQQRLTTLFVILALAPRVLGVDLSGQAAGMHGDWSDLLANKLDYEGRPDARADLRRLAQRGDGAINSLRTDGIKNAAEIVLAAISLGKDEQEPGTMSGSAPRHSAAESPAFTAADLRYLLEHVVILRTKLPPRTDLNHYFEVMNTRGEQLEKHEILKARLMSALVDDPVEQAIFSQVWDACSILDRHIQVQFTPSTTQGPSERASIFGDTWDQLLPDSGDSLFGSLKGVRSRGHSPDSQDGALSHIALTEVLGSAQVGRAENPSDSSEDESGTYGSIIDFPNLLLHVLKIFRNETFDWDVDIDSTPGHVRLEDKYLLEEFDTLDTASSGDHSTFEADAVREFAFLLLKTRFLMDSYVIRTQASASGDQEENWVLHRAYGAPQSKKRNGLQLSARNTFRANGSAGESGESEAVVQRQVLLLQSMFQVTDTRRQSKYFLFHILQWLNGLDHRSPVRGQDFIAILESSARDRLTALYSAEAVNMGTRVQNFLFNVLDYELWRLSSDETRMDQILAPATDVGRISISALRDAVGRFRFRYRTSVEHFYPQEPATAEGHERFLPDVVDQFGNLCLMSRSENSRRSNLMPEAKAKQFSSTGQSLNFQLMSAVAKEHQWVLPEIESHGAAMTRLLEDVIDSHRHTSASSSD